MEWILIGPAVIGNLSVAEWVQIGTAVFAILSIAGMGYAIHIGGRFMIESDRRRYKNAIKDMDRRFEVWRRLVELEQFKKRADQTQREFW